MTDKDKKLRAILASELAAQRLPNKLADMLANETPNEPWILCCVRALDRAYELGASEINQSWLKAGQ